MAHRNTAALLLTVAVGAAALVSCSLIEGLRAGKEKAEGPLVFSHKAHGEDFKCADCHAGAEKEARAGLPALTVCLDCHDEPDKGSTIEAAMAELRAREKAGALLWGAAQEGELKFDHGAHVKGVTYVLDSGQSKPLTCADCHGTPDKGGPAAHIPMELCTDCHERGAPAKDGAEGRKGFELLACSVCHAKIRADKAPEDHHGIWRIAHGEDLKFGLEKEEARRCGYCHPRESFCTDCHMRETPRSHTRFFRLRGHGIDASLSRDRCATCHLEDFCIRCHSSNRPVGHTVSWAQQPYRHCSGCHIPISMTRCAVCHTAKDQEHASAPLYPRDANHTGNCTMACHTRQHPDPGPVCTSCHK